MTLERWLEGKMLGVEVRLTAAAKRKVGAEHAREFGGSIGNVLGYVRYKSTWPEVDVCWQASGLKYCYHPSMLEVITLVRSKKPKRRKSKP